MQENAPLNRIVLLIVMAIIVAALVLSTTLQLLPTPPGEPTPTAPAILDRPEGRPRIRD